jgi:hypothetical protein
MNDSVRVYELYPVPTGFSNRTADYAGTIIAVAAPSNDEAHNLAERDVWAEDPLNPLGILWTSRRGTGPDHKLFNDDQVYGNGVIGVRHGATKRAIVAWMQAVLR